MSYKIMLRATIPALAIVLAYAGVANAADAPAVDANVCHQRIDEVRAEWKASGIPTSAARAMNGGNGRNHDHPAMVTSYMQGQIARAESLCEKGEDHDALLHLDVVRSWLKLPFEDHPVAHNYHVENGPVTWCETRSRRRMRRTKCYTMLRAILIPPV